MLKKTTSHAAPQTAPLARPLFALLACALCVTALNVSRAQSGPLEDLSVFPRTSLEILHGKKQADPRVFNVWIANNEARQEQGLMFVQDLPQGQGMLFPLKKPKKMTLWMKNTYVELDMLFISEKGVVQQIVEHARPLALDHINSDKDAGAVLEIKGGEAQRLDIKVGDHVNWTPPERCDCSPAEPVHTPPK